MKKIMSFVLILALASVMILSLVSCGEEAEKDGEVIKYYDAQNNEVKKGDPTASIRVKQTYDNGMLLSQYIYDVDDDSLLASSTYCQFGQVEAKKYDYYMGELTTLEHTVTEYHENGLTKKISYYDSDGTLLGYFLYDNEGNLLNEDGYIVGQE